jgi:uncharacterized protein YecT (DUF1311 family)
MAIHTKVAVSPSKTTIAATFPGDPQCENGDDVMRGDCVGSQLTAAQRQLVAALIFESKYLPVSSIHASQADWATYRNAECRLVALQYEGGTIYPWIVGACEWRLTQQRLANVRLEDATLKRELGGPLKLPQDLETIDPIGLPGR